MPRPGTIPNRNVGPQVLRYLYRQPQLWGMSPRAYLKDLGVVTALFGPTLTIPTPVQVGVSSNSTTTTSPTLSGVTAGNTLVACIENGSGVAFTGPGSNWTQAVASNNGSGTESEIWYLSGANNAGGTFTPVFTATGAVSSKGFLSEWKNIDPTNPLDQVASSNATATTSCASGTLSGNAATSVAITMFVEKTSNNASVTFTPGTGYTLLKSDGDSWATANHYISDYRLLAPVGDSETVTSSKSSLATGWAGCIATFAAAPQAPTSIPKQWQSGVEGNASLAFTGGFGPFSTSKILSATVNLAGATKKAVTRALAGGLSFTGNWVKLFPRLVSLAAKIRFNITPAIRGTWVLQEAHIGPQGPITNSYVLGNAVPSSIPLSSGLTGYTGDQIHSGDTVAVGFGPGVSENLKVTGGPYSLGATSISIDLTGSPVWAHNHSAGEIVRAISTANATGFKDPVAASPGLDNSQVTTALTTPDVTGFCVRVGLVDLYDSSGNFASDLLDYAKAKADANGLKFAFRIMAGRYTPPRVFDTLGARSYVDSRVTPLRSPVPFNTDGTQETIFGPWLIAAIQNELSSWATTNGASILHGSWYACQFSEVNLDDEMSQLQGYNYNTWLAAHNAITDAMGSVMTLETAVEVPLSGNGCTTAGIVTVITVTNGGSGYTSGATASYSSGSATATVQVSGGVVTGLTITNAGSGYDPKNPPTITISPVGAGSGAAAFAGIGISIGSIDNDLGARMKIASQGQKNLFFTQLNGITDVSALIMSTQVGHGLQMNSVLNSYDWNAVWTNEVYPNKAAYLEVYAPSFTGGTVASLKTNITNWLTTVNQMVDLTGSTGIFVRKDNKSLAASLTPVGVIVRALAHVLAAATLNLTGATTKAVAYPLGAGASFAGAITRSAGHKLTGVLNFDGGIPIASVQFGVVATGSTTVAPTLSSVTAGNLVVASISNSIGKEFKSSSSNWVRGPGRSNTTAQAEIWYLAGINNPGGTITPTFTTEAGGVTRGVLSEWKGLDPTNPLNVYSSSTATLSLTGGSGTVSGNNATDLAVTCFHESHGTSIAVTLTPGANYTNIANNASTATFHHLTTDYRLNVPLGDSETQTSSISGGWAGVIASFQAPHTYLLKQVKFPVLGTLNLTGTIHGPLAQILTATISFTGAVVKGASHNLTGATLNLSGTITRAISHVVFGTLGPAGIIKRATSRVLAGTLNLSGAVNRIRFVALSAGLALAGVISRLRGKGLNATLSFSARGPAVEGTWGLLDISANGLISPPQTPALSQQVPGTLPVGLYTIGYTWTRAGFESGLSITRNVTLTAGNGSIRVAAITGIPSGVTAITPYFTAAPAGATVGILPQQIPVGGSTAVFNITADATTHAMPQTGGTVLLQPNTSWNAMVAQPGLRGMCVRIGWNILSNDGINYDFSILQPYLTSAQNAGVKFALRIMAGQWTPAGYFTGGGNAYNGPNPAGNITNPGSPGAARVPYPWALGGGVNLAFEALYSNFATQAAAWCRANNVPLLHFANYGYQYSEMYFGAAVKTGDWTYARFITGHQRLYNIAAGIMGNDLAIEFPLSGTGSLWTTGISSVDTDMATYAATLSGNNPSIFFVQLNGFGSAPTNAVAVDAVTTAGSKIVTSAGGHFVGASANDNISIPGAGAGGTTLNVGIASTQGNGGITLDTNAGTSGTFTATFGGGLNVDGSWQSPIQYAGQHNEQNDLDMQSQTYITGLGHAAQMIQPNSYNWNTLYSAMISGPPGPYNTKYLEVYVASDTIGNFAQLNSNIASFQPGGSSTATATLIKLIKIPIPATVGLAGKVTRVLARRLSSGLGLAGTINKPLQKLLDSVLRFGNSGFIFSNSPTTLTSGDLNNPTGNTLAKKILRAVDGTLWMSYSNDVLGDNPSAYFRLDAGVVNDKSATHTHPGTAHGGVTATLQPPLAALDADKAMFFDGTPGTYIDGRDLGSPPQWTMEVWVNLSGPQPANYTLFTDVLDGGLVRYALVGHFSLTGDTDLQVRAAVFNGVWTYTPAVTLIDGFWQHVVATWDGKKITIYRQGIARGSVNFS